MEQQSTLHAEHLTYFRVENFKRFDSFEMDEIGQFNLLVGDNNVGKTSVLEALLFDEDVTNSHAKWRANLTAALAWAIGQKSDNDSNGVNLSSFTKNIDTTLTCKLIYKKNKNNENDFLIFEDTNTNVYNLLDTPCIFFGLGYRGDCLNEYKKNVYPYTSKEKEFNDAMSVFIPKIDAIKPIDSILISEKGRDIALPLSLYGEGANKIFRIALMLNKHRGKRLMIDEIDAGIHFTHFRAFWRFLLLAARAYDVQIFATTHNPDCLKYLKEALEDPELENDQELQDATRVFHLDTRRDNSVFAVPFTFPQFQANIDLGNEIR